MKSQKRYSNTTFSKRVDHDAGRHRGPQAPSEPAKCVTCGAVYADRRWTVAGTPKSKSGKHRHWQPQAITVCPGCLKKQEGLAAGLVYLSGDFLPSHRPEIERLLTNEAERAVIDNPLAQIMGRETDENGRLVISTTTEHFAQRLGHALEKAFDGEVRYDFSHENKLARVYWHRD
ncbi:MAG TPA: BCAM0308 family protein [Blastocatellia bacterium]|nr:BCAM0308 family protein [Blastocatellia bacterium]